MERLVPVFENPLAICRDLSDGLLIIGYRTLSGIAALRPPGPAPCNTLVTTPGGWNPYLDEAACVADACAYTRGGTCRHGSFWNSRVWPLSRLWVKLRNCPGPNSRQHWNPRLLPNCWRHRFQQGRQRHHIADSLPWGSRTGRRRRLDRRGNGCGEIQHQEQIRDMREIGLPGPVARKSAWTCYKPRHAHNSKPTLIQ
jgi:hypothetical protein